MKEPCVCVSLTVSEFTNADEASLVLVKDLETSDVIFWFAQGTETIRTADNLDKSIEIN